MRENNNEEGRRPMSRVGGRLDASGHMRMRRQAHPQCILIPVCFRLCKAGLPRSSTKLSWLCQTGYSGGKQRRFLFITLPGPGDDGPCLSSPFPVAEFSRLQS